MATCDQASTVRRLLAAVFAFRAPATLGVFKVAIVAWRETPSSRVTPPDPSPVLSPIPSTRAFPALNPLIESR